MGVVYRAVRDDDAYRMEVALKVVPAGTDSPFLLQRFHHERQILAGLEHPYIARLLDGGATEQGLPYFVMELVDGVPIDVYCADRALPLHARIDLFQKVCEAVAHAHRNLVVHRDLKPGNILVTAEGSPKLLDFGVAKILAPVNPEAAVTKTAFPMMTLEYASPEQVAGEPVTTASDVYSLGVLLYLLLTGQKPYRLKTAHVHELGQAIAEQEPTRPSALPGASAFRRQLEGDLDTIVLHALRKEPTRRYSSVERLSEDLRRYRTGLPVNARKDTLGYRAGKFVRRHWAGVAAAGLVFLSLLAGVVATARQARIAEAHRQRAEQRFTDLRRLANSLLFEFHDAIETLPGATAARALVLTRASEHLDRLAVDAPGDPALAEELALAYHKLADAQGGFGGSANLGESDAALLNHRKALALREGLARAKPQDREAQGRLARSHVLLSYAEPDRARAIEHARTAIAINERVAAAEPANTRLQQPVAVAQYALGAALAGSGDLRGATAAFEAANRVFEAIYEAEPEGKTSRRDLALSEKRLSGILAVQGDLKGALPRSERALALDEATAAANPDSAPAKRDLTVSLVDLAEARINTGDVKGGVTLLERALLLRRQLRDADTKNALATHDLASVLTRLGGAESRQGESGRALPHLEEALALLGSDPTLGAERATAKAALAAAHDRMGHASAALRYWRAAREERRAQVATVKGPYGWVSQTDMVRESRDFGRFLEREAGRASLSAAERAGYRREAHSIFEEGLRAAEALARDNHLVGESVSLPEEMRQGLSRTSG
jgi:non-specific serine/threonine protein kinase/serine/threonine-protein kinase